jgi:protein involved in sex pheromone biosynthesis
MICTWCEQVFTIDDMCFVIKGEDDKWYHPKCLKEKNDKGLNPAKETKDVGLRPPTVVE